MKKYLIIGIIVLIVFMVVYFYLENTSLENTFYKINSDELPGSFNGYKIAHMSDFHNTKSTRLQKQIIKSLKQNKPDILVITGDLIDSRRTNIKVSLEFIKEITGLPIYYVAGNHESRIKDYPTFKANLESLGVVVLENEKITLSKGKEKVELIGLQDPSFEISEDKHDDMIPVVEEYLANLVDQTRYSILLSHRPELLDLYAQSKVDLVFSGHAHGGQIIIPIIGPVIAPNQGYFPKLTNKVHQKNGTNLVISRGIGNSLCPIRFNNNPELVYVTLEK